MPLARQTGAAGPYYKAKQVARQAHAHGVYLIGRIVTFEDPVLAEKRPDLAIRSSDGSIWHTNGGLAWTNPYDRRVWQYNVDLAAAAAKAGFDEIQFDYVRFPSDGDISLIRYPGKHTQPMRWTIPAFVQYAAKRLHPLGARVSVDVFGLSATRDLGIGQLPRRVSRYVDAVYPMVYPSHFNSGEYGISDPNAASRRDGHPRAAGLPACAGGPEGQAYALAAGLLARADVHPRRRARPGGRCAGRARQTASCSGTRRACTPSPSSSRN